MFILETIVGIISFLIFTTSAYLSFKILNQFEQDKELAATKIFLQGAMVKSLKALIFGIIAFTITALITLYATINNLENELLRNSFRIGTIILFLTYLYLTYNIRKSVKNF